MLTSQTGRATLPRNFGLPQRKCLLALALYDNVAEAADELAFCKGDILTVLEHHPHGLAGWWLCSLRGRHGICPGNRLRMLGHVQSCNSPAAASSPSSPAGAVNAGRHVRQASDPLRGYGLQTPTSPSAALQHQMSPGVHGGSPAASPMGTARVERRFANPNKVIIPHKVGDVYLYACPEPRHMTPSPTVKTMDMSMDGHRLPSGLTYDTPRSHQPMSNVSLIRGLNPSLHPSFGGGTAPPTTYDIPRGANESYDIPRSHQSPHLHHQQSSPAPSIECNTDYDIPRGGHPEKPEDDKSTANTTTNKEFRCYEDSGILESGGSSDDVAAGLAALAIQHMEGAYDVPQSLASRLSSSSARSNRSSCASLSSSSSGPSPLQSQDSLTPSLSLSSLGGGNSSSNRSSLEQPHDLYDIPRAIAACTGSSGGNSVTSTTVITGNDDNAGESDLYDVPTPTTEVPHPLLPPPAAFLAPPTVAAFVANTCDSVYDVPPQVTRDLAPLRSSGGSVDATDAAAAVDGGRPLSEMGPEVGTELPLELHAAMDVLVSLVQAVQTSTNRLFKAVGTKPAQNSRQAASSQQQQQQHLMSGARSYELKEACQGVLSSLQEFADFANGAQVNASRGADSAVYMRLKKLQRPLHDAVGIVGQTFRTMEEHAWAFGNGGVASGAGGGGGGSGTQSTGPAAEALEHLCACARTLGDDVRQVACFIQGNSTLIFKKAANLPPQLPPPNQNQLVAASALLAEDALNANSCAMTSHSPPASLPPKNRERPLPPTPNSAAAAAAAVVVTSPPSPAQTPQSVVSPVSTILRRGPTKLPPTPLSKRLNSGKDAVDEEENIYENDDRAWVDDYEYVSLESKESVQARSEAVKAALPEGLRQSFDDVLQESLVPVECQSIKGGGTMIKRLPGMTIGGGGKGIISSAVNAPAPPPQVRLDANDRQLVCFYEKQLDLHGAYLNNAIQAFLLTVEGNHPPKVFVDHGKFVILGAHKLVFIGDTIHRHAALLELRQRAQRTADDICDAMKGMVQRVKSAALQFPSVLAVQEMVDSVVDVSHAACELKAVVSHYARL